MTKAVQDELDGLEIIAFDEIPPSPYEHEEGDGEIDEPEADPADADEED